MNSHSGTRIGPKSMKSKWKLTFQDKEKGIVTAPINGVSKTKTKTLDELYIVEKILRKKVDHGVTKYLIKWEGWASSSNTWEPVDHIPINMITEFEEEAKSKRVRALNPIPGSNNTVDNTPTEKQSFNEKFQVMAQTDIIHIGYIAERDQDDDIHMVPFAKNIERRTVEHIETVTYKSSKNDPTGNPKLIFIVRFEDSHHPEAVTAIVARKMFPNKVIEYFESIITFS